MRRERPGSIQSAVSKAFTSAGKLECVRDDLGVSIGMLSNATDFNEKSAGGIGVNHLHRLCRIHSASAVPLAQHFAHLALGEFIPLNVDGAVGADMSELMSEFADVLRTHAAAMSDKSRKPNDYTQREALDAIKEVDEMLAAGARVRAALAEKARGV